MTHPERRTAPPLRVGVMLDTTVVRRWIADLVTEIAGSSYAELALVVLNEEEPPAPSRRERLRLGRPSLFHVYQRLDYRRNRDQVWDAFEPVELEGLLAQAPQLRVLPESPRRFEHRLRADDVERIREHGLDVMLRFGFKIVRGEILDCARYGVWSYHHGDNTHVRGGPALFWEIAERNPVSGTMLQILTDELDAGHVLYRSWSATDAGSLYRNRNATYWKTAAFVPRRLRHLAERGWEFLASLDTFAERVDNPRPIYRTPSNARMLGFLARQALDLARWHAVRRLCEEQWFVALGPARPVDATRDAVGFEVVRAARGRSLADPFVFEHDGDAFVFVEQQDRGSPGVIACGRIGGGGVPRFETVLERPHHLSYPGVFASAGDVYMLPETAAARRVELYRATEFPLRWERVAVLLDDVQMVDPTLVHRDGLWWLFGNVPVKGAAPDDELSLFFGRTLTGPFEAHPLNPIVSDVRRARPAGRIFERDGRLIRPAQDCSTRYGYAVVLNRIDILTTTDYRETEVGRIGPDWISGNRGTHTYTSSAHWSALDGRHRRLRSFRGARS